MTVYQFDERLAMSDGVSVTGNIKDILLDNIPGAVSVTRTDLATDKSGVDWWVTVNEMVRFGIDLKARTEDYAAKQPPEDDLALELWSVMPGDDNLGKVGWTLDYEKKTDYILWFWEDTKRWCLVPFSMLCAVFRDNFRDWESHYKAPIQCSKRNGGEWKSQCVYVPRRLVWAEIYKRFGGAP